MQQKTQKQAEGSDKKGGSGKSKLQHVNQKFTEASAVSGAGGAGAAGPGDQVTLSLSSLSLSFALSLLCCLLLFCPPPLCLHNFITITQANAKLGPNVGYKTINTHAEGLLGKQAEGGVKEVVKHTFSLSLSLSLFEKRETRHHAYGPQLIHKD